VYIFMYFSLFSFSMEGFVTIGYIVHPAGRQGIKFLVM
jgi:hypothetical protein